MKSDKAKKRDYLITQLARALREVRENGPERCDRAYTNKLAARFGVHPKTMKNAILIQAMTLTEPLTEENK